MDHTLLHFQRIFLKKNILSRKLHKNPPKNIFSTRWSSLQFHVLHAMNCLKLKKIFLQTEMCFVDKKRISISKFIREVYLNWSWMIGCSNVLVKHRKRRITVRILWKLLTNTFAVIYFRENWKFRKHTRVSNFLSKSCAHKYSKYFLKFTFK